MRAAPEAPARPSPRRLSLVPSACSEPDVTPCTCDQTTVTNVQNVEICGVITGMVGAGAGGGGRGRPLWWAGPRGSGLSTRLRPVTFTPPACPLQLTFGFLADVIGRKWGSRLTMAIMFVGGVLLTGACEAGGGAARR